LQLVSGGAGPLGLHFLANRELGFSPCGERLTIPYRGQTGRGTYFITANCYMKQYILQSDRMARLLGDVLYHYRETGKYLLHHFVIMPNHFHLLMTPLGQTTLERAMQYVKGGFTHRAKKELNHSRSIWQTSYFDRRVRNSQEFQDYVAYIHQNPVKGQLCADSKDWPYSCAQADHELDPLPQRLKPV
jgi:putative transposase